LQRRAGWQGSRRGCFAPAGKSGGAQAPFLACTAWHSSSLRQQRKTVDVKWRDKDAAYADDMVSLGSSLRMPGCLSTALCRRFAESYQYNLPGSSVLVIW
jgi:hypothetical protein